MQNQNNTSSYFIDITLLAWYTEVHSCIFFSSSSSFLSTNMGYHASWHLAISNYRANCRAAKHKCQCGFIKSFISQHITRTISCCASKYTQAYIEVPMNLFWMQWWWSVNYSGMYQSVCWHFPCQDKKKTKNSSRLLFPVVTTCSNVSLYSVLMATDCTSHKDWSIHINSESPSIVNSYQ